MTSASTSPTYLDPTSKIDQATYDEFAANWLKIVGEGGDQTALNACFNTSDKPVTRLVSVSFTVAQITEVLSAPGIAQVRARFVVNPKKEAPNFAIVLYGVDAQGRRQTSYYLSDYRAGMKSNPPIVDVELPNVLRQHWVNNWADTEQFPLTRQLFATSYGPLQGFNFSLSDFMQPLMRSTSEDDNLSILLGLHTYFGPSPEGEAVTATFGLLVQAPIVAGRQGDDDLAYDVAAPSPPAP
ncbi:hypothetical protein GCM10027594_12080 [Hymenobacter agri]